MTELVRPLRVTGAPAPVTEQTAPQKVLIIEGRRVAVFDRRPPLPPRLDVLLTAPEMRVFPVKITGWRSQCSEQEHRLYPVAEGPYQCHDGQRRDLRVLMCADCESVCVRDVSLDMLPVRAGRRGFARRDRVMGWYSGSRRNRREYR
jgi:hypothetical protein